MPTIRASLLGGLRLSIDGRAIERADFERVSGLRLLKLLLATPGHRVRREAAAELLWPEAPEARSAVNVRKAVHFARRALEDDAGPAVFAGSTAWLEFDPGVEIDVDVDRLRTALEGVRAPRKAGADQDAIAGVLEAVIGFGATDVLPEDPFEEWLIPLRERLHVQRLSALGAAAETARAIARPDLAHRLVDLLLELEPADEGAHRLAIELYIDDGRIDLARRQLLRCASAIADLYGVAPSATLGRLIEDASSHRARRVTARPGSATVGAVLLSALVDAVAAIADGRPLVLAYENVRLERPGAALVGAFRR